MIKNNFSNVLQIFTPSSSFVLVNLQVSDFGRKIDSSNETDNRFCIFKNFYDFVGGKEEPTFSEK